MPAKGVRSEVVVKRQKQVLQMAVVQRMTPQAISEALGLSVKTIYVDLKRMRDANLIGIKTPDSSGTPAAEIMHDIIVSSNHRIRMIWKRIKDIQDHYTEILDGIKQGFNIGQKSDMAMALRLYDSTLRALFKSLREEEEHQVKTLTKFGIVGAKQIQIQQEIRTRDETPLVQAVANFINTKLPPEQRRELQNSLRQLIVARSAQLRAEPAPEPTGTDHR